MCPHCNVKLKVQKTKRRKGIFLDFGRIWFQQRHKYCGLCGSVFDSEYLNALIPECANFGFDIIELVGRELFIKNRTESEITTLLEKRNVEISPSEVTFLGKKFILYLAQAHKEKEPEIKNLINLRGGYFVHLDSTCDGDSPHLFCAVEELLKLVLVSRKIPSESCEAITPILQDLKKKYGTPTGIVCDMSKGIISAVEEVFPEIRIFICHFHWLRDIGKDLLKEDDSFLGSVLRDFEVKPTLSKFSREFRGLIRNYPILSVSFKACVDDFFKQKLPEEIIAHLLIEWIQDYTSELNGYGFPFDRSNVSLVDRMIKAYEHLKKLNIQSGHLMRIKQFLEGILSSEDLQECLRDLKRRMQYFDHLREIMRIAQLHGVEGLNDDGKDADMPLMKKELTAFAAREDIKKAAQTDRCVRKMLKQIDKYKDRLFTTGVEVTDANGVKIRIFPERTNNLLERTFRDEKRGHRKRTGYKSMSKILKTMLAETPYVKNLGNADYLKIILNGKITLAERFAEIDSAKVRDALKKHNEKLERLDPKVKQVIKVEGMLQSLIEMVSNFSGDEVKSGLEMVG
jgi:ribosome-associated translation inhibitor RaiA